MSAEKKLLRLLSAPENEANITELTELITTADNAGDTGDLHLEITNVPTAAVANREYEAAIVKGVTNPADTWPFKKDAHYVKPKTLLGIVQAVQDVEAGKIGNTVITGERKMRPLGSRHSYSEVDQTYLAYIDLAWCDGLDPESLTNTKAKLTQDALNLLTDSSEANKRKYFDVPGGMKIHQLNRILCPEDAPRKSADLKNNHRSLYNMGGGDVQAFAGAFSTGTHGSCGKYSAYHDMIRSMIIVGSGGKVYRLEPASAPITDKTKHDNYYKNKPVKVELVYDDDLFKSALVSMGCFGIIYSCIIEVRPMRMLHAEATYKGRKSEGWNDSLKAKIKKGRLRDDEDYYYYLQINPYKRKLRTIVSVLEKEITFTANENFGKKESRKKWWPEFLSSLKIAPGLIRDIANRGPKPKIRLIEAALRAQNDNKDSGDGYTDLTYKIWNAGTGKMSSIGTGIEFAFPLDKAVATMDVLLAFIEVLSDTNKGWYLNAPMAMRFVRPGDAYMAPNYRYRYTGRQLADGTMEKEEIKEWVYFEILRINPKQGNLDVIEEKIYHTLQTFLLENGGRPHWGLNFGMKMGENIIEKLYPEFDKWLKAYLKFNSTGVFDNEFTKASNFRERAIRKWGAPGQP